MIFSALLEAAERGELILTEGGMCRWHRRRDGVVVVREILVQPWLWRQGIGRRLIDEVRAKNPGCPVLARCPASYEANKFWESLGFALSGRKGSVNEWLLQPSSGAPTATPHTPESPSPPAGATESGCPPEAC